MKNIKIGVLAILSGLRQQRFKQKREQMPKNVAKCLSKARSRREDRYGAGIFENRRVLTPFRMENVNHPENYFLDRLPLFIFLSVFNN